MQLSEGSGVNETGERDSMCTDAPGPLKTSGRETSVNRKKNQTLKQPQCAVQHKAWPLDQPHPLGFNQATPNGYRDSRVTVQQHDT